MEIDLHLLDRKYEGLKVRNRKEETRLVATLADNGEVSPVVVVKSGETEGRYVVIDGYKRLRAVSRLGQDVVTCVVWEHNEIDALVMVHHFQRPRERSQLEDAYLVQALHDVHGLRQPEIARRLGRSTSWVSRRLGLVKDLPDWLQKHVQEGKLQCHAAMKYFLPMARANKEDAERLARAIAGAGFSTRQIAELYRTWMEGDERARELVVSRPETVLRARQACSEPPDNDAQAVLRDMEMLVAIGRRVSRLVDRAILQGMERSVADRVLMHCNRIRRTVREISNRIDKEVKRDDRPGDAPGCTQAQEVEIWHPPDSSDSQNLPLGSAGGYRGRVGRGADDNSPDHSSDASVPN
jgi:ParB family transcriptional regulator, chromosome partitioning protein